MVIGRRFDSALGEELLRPTLRESCEGPRHEQRIEAAMLDRVAFRAFPARPKKRLHAPIAETSANCSADERAMRLEPESCARQVIALCRGDDVSRAGI